MNMTLLIRAPGSQLIDAIGSSYLFLPSSKNYVRTDISSAINKYYCMKSNFNCLIAIDFIFLFNLVIVSITVGKTSVMF